METMEDPGSSRRKKGRFVKKKDEKLRSSSACSHSSLAPVEIAAVCTPSELPRESLDPKKKRRRSDENLLADENCHSERYHPEKLKYEGEHHSLVTRALTPGIPFKRVKRAMKAARVRTFLIDDDGDMFENANDGHRMSGEGLQASRRCAIAYLFEHVFGNPAESLWKGRRGIISQVMNRLNIPSESMRLVRKVVEDVAKAKKEKKPYDQHSGPRERGRDVAIVKDSRESAIVYRGMKSGIGITETTVMVNEFRISINLKPICWSAVKNYIARNPKLMRLHKRTVKKSGKDDPNCPWAEARRAQASQIRRQIQLGLVHLTRMALQT
jgi:hypothetical protein